MPTPITLKVFRGSELVRTEQFSREIIKIADTPAVGPADARVTVVEYSDMECPSCKKRTSDWDALQAKLAPDVAARIARGA